LHVTGGLIKRYRVFYDALKRKADLHTFASAVSADLPDKIVFKEMGGVPGPKKILEQLVNVYNL
jgi:hypothetical protein